MSRRGFGVGALALVIAMSLFGAGSRAQAADSIDTLKASDAELTAKMSELDAQVRKQQAVVDAAAQSVAAADATLKAREGELAQTQGDLDVLRKAAAQRAIQLYMAPKDTGITSVLAADDLADAEQRSVLVAQINDRGQAAVDDLVAARSKLDDQRETAEASRADADKRRAAAQSTLDQLNATRGQQLVVHKAIKDRIANAQAEAAAAAATANALAAGRANRGGAASPDSSRISAAGMQWPIVGPIRSPFGARWGSMHTGIDIGATEGDTIHAAKAGTVIKASFDGSGYGNLVVVDNGNGVETWYAHQSRIAVSVGQVLKNNDLIGYVGHTGHVVPASSAGAHLHFEVRINGTPKNPQSYLP